MRLTKSIRSAFVRSAMNDVPTIDYEEQIRNLLVNDVIDQMPPEVLTAYKKYPHVFTKTGEYYHRVGYVYLPCEGIKPRPEATAKAEELIEKMVEQRKAKSDLMDKLEATALSVSTRKALVALLPEFEKYLPKEDEPSGRQLPAIANLVAEFTKAGWPKEQATA